MYLHNTVRLKYAVTYYHLTTIESHTWATISTAVFQVKDTFKVIRGHVAENISVIFRNRYKMVTKEY